METLVELRATDGALLQYSWFFEGVGGRGDQPKVRITATGDAEAGRRLRSAWESMLTSLRPSSPRKE